MAGRGRAGLIWRRQARQGASGTTARTDVDERVPGGSSLLLEIACQVGRAWVACRAGASRTPRRWETGLRRRARVADAGEALGSAGGDDARRGRWDGGAEGTVCSRERCTAAGLTRQGDRQTMRRCEGSAVEGMPVRAWIVHPACAPHVDLTDGAMGEAKLKHTAVRVRCTSLPRLHPYPTDGGRPRWAPTRLRRAGVAAAPALARHAGADQPGSCMRDADGSWLCELWHT